FFLVEPSANNVWYRVDTIVVLDRGTNTNGSGSFPHRTFLQQSVFLLFVHVLLAVVRDVDKRWFKLHQRIAVTKEVLNVFALQGRKYLCGEQGFSVCVLQVFGNFHI